MSASMPPEACGCCEPERRDFTVDNPPGQPEIRFRLAAHGGFLQRMLARLSRWTLPDGEHAGTRPLARLTTRQQDDFTIALLDGWATVLEVLSFYQERIANESFLRTATERRSVLELARAIGYELRPGVAASTWLAFTLEEGETAPKEVRIPAGTPVSSIPQKEGERPQTFETDEELVARPEWNAMRPRQTRPQTLTLNSQEVWLQGTDLGISPGDRMLLVQKDEEGRVSEVRPKRVHRVEVDRERGVTHVAFEPPVLKIKGKVRATVTTATSSRVDHSLLSGHAKAIFGRTVDDAQLRLIVRRRKWTLGEWSYYLGHIARETPSTVEVFAFRQKAGIFGHNAPLYRMLPYVRTTFHDWDANGWSIWHDSVKRGNGSPQVYADADLYLERVVEGVVQDSWLLLEPSERKHNGKIFRISATIERSVAGFGMSSRVTGLKLAKPDGTKLEDQDKSTTFKARTTTAYLVSERLDLAEAPMEGPVESNRIELDTPVSDLEPGRAVWISGELVNSPFTRRGEIRFIDRITHQDGVTVLTLTTELEHRYRRDSVTINANVVSATHGETVEEVLGSGNGSRPFQRFTLRRPPLTYVSAEVPSGARSTLTVRVNGIAWQEVASFYGREAEERCYTVRHDDEGNATVQFGDGRHGARLPTGRENVVARYRSGIGLEGRVEAESLTVLPRRPLGVEAVTNPRLATGAADPETLAEARQNAPLTVLTLERIVSLQDCEDFARAFAGIGKARAVAFQRGGQPTVRLIVAAAGGSEIDPSSRLYRNLQRAIERARDPRLTVELKSFRKQTFGVKLRIARNDTTLWDSVAQNLRQRLERAFSFDNRNFGQPVTTAEILAVAHQVEAIRAVDIDSLWKIQDGKNGPPPSLLRASPEDLLLLDPPSLEITEMSA